MDNKIYGGGHLNTQQSQQNQFQNSQQKKNYLFSL